MVQTPLQRALDTDDAPRIGGARETWPDSLEKFREWWMSEASLADGALDRRVPPRGLLGPNCWCSFPSPRPTTPKGC